MQNTVMSFSKSDTSVRVKLTRIYFLLACLTAGILFFSLIAYSGKKPGTIATAVNMQTVFDKLLGTWQSVNGKTYEQWTKKTNGNYESRVFGLRGSDTLWKERASIYPEKGNWVFENTVSDQNNGRAIRFTSTIINDNSVQFSNPEHDFPTDINYTVIDQNTLHAFIAGPNSKGGKDTIPFNYKRVN